MRFGLVGTAFWARETHAAALNAVDEVDFVGVWGRDPQKAAALAAHAGVTAFDSVEALLDGVDAVVFSVPPDVQSALAESAARAGKHLLLEKPVAASAEAAAGLATAVREAGVASVVFFTTRYTPEGRAWLASLEGSTWEGGTATYLANAFRADSPFDTPWRREKGGLWDVGPHALSMLTASLGRITSVYAVGGVRDLVHLVLEHEGGATSTAALSLTTPEPAQHMALEIWGPAGRTSMPTRGTPAVEAAQTALRELIAAANGSGGPVHPCDVEFGRYVVDLLEQAQHQVDAGRGGSTRL